MEIWKDIEGYFGLYQVSSIGRVKSLKYGKERILKPAKDKNNYLGVCLYKQGNKKTNLVHRLVAEAFIDNQNNLPQVNHKNEVKTDNRVENLEFCDAKYNINYGTRNKRVAEKCSKQVMCVETNIIYKSINEVERQLGFCKQNISSACNGKLKQAYGFHWQYIE